MAYDAAGHWRIAIDDGSSGPTAVNTLLSPQHALAVGDSGDYLCYFAAGGNIPRGYQQRHGDLLALADHAGSYATGIDIGNELIYTEAHNATSLLVALRPPANEPTLRGIWALVDDVSDETNLPQTQWAISLSLTYIARASQYSDHAAVRAAHEREGFH